MCTYGIDTKEIVEAIDKALNGIEGDFSNKELFEALEICKRYPYTSNSKRSKKKWEDYINEE